MDEAVGGLEIEFKRVVNDLEYVSHHLEKDFRSRQASSGESDVVALIRRISALESNLITTKKRSEKLLTQRQQVTSMSAQIMLSNHARLSRLLEEFSRDDSAQRDSLDTNEDKENGFRSSNNMNNIDVNGNHLPVDKNNDNDDDPLGPEDRQEVRQALLDVLKECTFAPDVSQFDRDHDGTASSSSSSALLPPPPPSTTTNNNSGPPSTITTQTHLSTHPSIKSNAPFDASTTVTVTAPPSASSLPPFDRITANQFEAISSSTRGRCKLTDCQALLSRLVTHYTTNHNHHTGHKKTKKGGVATTAASSLMASLQNVPVLTMAELGTMGLKVDQSTLESIYTILYHQLQDVIDILYCITYPP